MIAAGLNIIQQALSIFDQDLRLVLINRPMQQMFSLPNWLVTPGVSFAEVIRYLAERGEYGEVEDFDDFVKIRVERARAFESHFIERTRANGRVITVEGAPLPEGGWVTVYTDITSTKQQEALLRARSEVLSEQVLARSEELSTTNRELAASNTALEEAKHQLIAMEARTRLTAQMMPAHIAHVDLDQHYTFSNRRLGDVIPGRPSIIEGRSAEEALGAQAHAAISPYLDMAYNGQSSVFEFHHIESSRRIRTAFTPDKDGTDIRGVYILSMDVTEETQTRVALQQTHRREMAAKLTSGLAHDFSNLLTIILGMQAKLQRMDLPPEASALITATLSAARRGGGLLNGIADMTGPREYSPVPVNLHDFLNDLAVMGRAALSAETTLDMHCEAPRSSYLLDPGMLQDSLLNLILNARDATEIDGTITIHARAVKETWLEFIVTDTGPGFSDAALTDGFQPFFTTKGGEGSGLGLAMVYDLTKIAGGEVRLSNTSAGGQVVLRLPLRAAQSEPARGALVLLVEDSDDLRVSIRHMLIAQGHSVLEASRVAEAETLLDAVADITHVLSDIQLGGRRTGIDLISQSHSKPVTLMTSLPVTDPLHRAAVERTRVLQKPFSSAELAGAFFETSAKEGTA